VGRTDEALAALQGAHRIQRESGGAEHPQAATIASNLGNMLRRRGHAAEAVALHRDLVASQLRKGDVDAESTLWLRDNLADDLRALGRCAEAEPEYHAAIEGRERALGPEVFEIAHPLIGLGLCRLRGGDLVGARASFERAVKSVAAHPDERDAGAAHFALAMLLRRAGEPVETVEHHVDLARARFGVDPLHCTVLIAALERFTAGDEIVDLEY
jgi:tetratricopeptide (TPR) repeat protein